MQVNEASTRAAWVGIVQQLCDQLQENDEKINFLGRIDRSMADSDLTLEQFVSIHLKDLTQFARAERVHFYIDTGNELKLFESTRLRSSARPDHLSYDTLAPIFPPHQQDLKVITKNHSEHLLQLFPYAACLLLATLPLSQDQSDNRARRLGLIILETPRPELIQPFGDQTVQTFVSTVVGQLRLGFQFRMNQRRMEWFNDLTKSFFELHLEPNACFKELSRKIPSYLPDFGPLKIDPSPAVSIAIYRAETNHLTIVGSTDGQYTGVRLKVEDSVVGLLFEEHQRPYVLGDPRQDPELKLRYKAYLGKREGKEIRTELAIPIQVNGRRVAVVNLESDLENIFTKIHINAMLELCKRLAPIVDALYSQLVERERQQEAVLYAQHSYWNTVGAILRHNTDSQLTTIRTGLDNAILAVQLNKVDRVEGILLPLQKTTISIKQEIVEFAEELHKYTIYGSYSIRQLINDAIAKMMRRVDREETTNKVQIDFTPGEDFEVFSSPILKMHLYNIMDNSIYWVKQRTIKEPDHQGKISIIVHPGPQPDEDQEIELNRSCEIIIEDNGVGCPPEELAKLLDQPVTSRRTGEKGMGHALYAAANYARMIGGDIQVDSQEGESFRIGMHLPLFDPRIHRIKNFTENL